MCIMMLITHSVYQEYINMKTNKIVAAVAFLCGISAVSFCVGREYESYYYSVDNLFEVHQELKDSCEKNYEAACLLADFPRYLMDHFDGETSCANIGMEIEECYYEWFQELDNGGFNTKYVTSIKDFDNYSWCY